VPVSITSPSFTNQDPASLCNISVYEETTGLKIIPQPGDALACLKYPQSASERKVLVNAVAGTIDSPECSDPDFPDFPSPCFPITLPSCPPRVTIKLEANPSSVDLGGESVITATVLSANNQPVNDATVIFTTTGGTLSSTTAKTNVSGQASTTLTAP